MRWLQEDQKCNQKLHAVLVYTSGNDGVCVFNGSQFASRNANSSVANGDLRKQWGMLRNLRKHWSPLRNLRKQRLVANLFSCLLQKEAIQHQ